MQAWESYHLGIHHFFRFTSDDNLLAQSYLKKSQELDPLFGEAFAWWAYAVTLGMVYWKTEPNQKNLDEALAESATVRLLTVVPEFCIELARKKLFYLKDGAQIELYLRGLSQAGIC